MKTLIFYIKLYTICLWTLFASILWLGISIVRWGDPAVFSQSVNFLGRGMFRILGLKLKIEGEENLKYPPPFMLTGNHQSSIDVAIYGYLCPARVVAIGKKEIFFIPVFGWLFKFAGGILLDRKNRSKAISQLNDTVAQIKKKNLAIGILPEGTRNKAGKGLLPFKKGAFHLAVAAQMPIIPLVISELAEIANFDRKNLHPGTITVKVLPPISTVGLTEKDVDALVEKTRAQMLVALSEIKSVLA